MTYAVRGLAFVWLIMSPSLSAIFGQSRAYLEFVDLPYMDDEFVITDFRDISDDGAYLIGASGPVRAVELMAVRDGVGQALGRFGEDYRLTQGELISGDGQVIFGRASGLEDDVSFRWTLDSGFSRVPFHVTAVNYDASILAGSDHEAVYVWSQSQGQRPLISSPEFASWELRSVVAMDQSGEVLLGLARHEISLQRRAFLATPHGFELLSEILPDGDLLPDDLSSDGRFVIGRHFPYQGSQAQAIRYDRLSGHVKVLPSIPSQNGWRIGGLVPQFINADGSQVIGFQAIEVNRVNDFIPFVWTEQAGSRTLMQVLQDDYGLEYQGEPLVNVRAVAKNSKVLYGVGRGAAGRSKQLDAWYVRIVDN